MECIVKSDIGWREKQNILPKGVETSPSWTCFKIMIRRYVTGQSRQYLLGVGLGCYKWYQSQILCGVLARTLGPQGGGL